MVDDWEEPLSVKALAGYEPEIGRVLWMLEGTRSRTKEALKGVDAAALDWTPPYDPNSIGTILYHVATVEMDWLYVEVLEQDFPQAVEALLPFDMRDEAGRLTAVTGLSLEDHLLRLDAARAYLLDAFRGMTLDDFRRLRHLEQYDVTPEWVLHHLIQHEAEHRGQIMALRSQAEKVIDG
ncbi:MAG TPA: DinB family protein [Anaerolineae bacterium]